MTATESTSAPSSTPELYAKRWWALGTLCLSLLIVIIGNTTLNVVMPVLSKKLNATNSQMQWVVAIYSLVFAGLLFSSGALGDRFGRKGALQIGLAIFFLGSLLASQSTTMTALIMCRGLMGVGAAFIMPSTLSILVNIFPPHERQKAIALWASVTGFGGTLGPIVSGILLSHFWYGSVFLVNLPVILFAFVTGWKLVPKSKDPHQGKLDPAGAVLSTVGIAALVYGLIQAPEHGWLSGGTLVWFAVAVVVLFMFVMWERRVDEPMLDMSFFRVPAFSTGVGGMILIFLSMFGVMFMVTQYFQLVLGYSPLNASLRFLPMTPIMIVVGLQTPKLTPRIGANRTVATGMLFVSTGMMSLLMLSTRSNFWVTFVCFILMGSGMALSAGPMTAAIMGAVPPRRAGAGSATNDATRELGAALGVAVLGSIAASYYGSHVKHLAKGLPAGMAAQASKSIEGALKVAGKLGGTDGPAFASGAKHSFVSALHQSAFVGSLVCLTACVLVYRFLPHSVSHAGKEQGHHG